MKNIKLTITNNYINNNTNKNNTNDDDDDDEENGPYLEGSENGENADGSVTSTRPINEKQQHSKSNRIEANEDAYEESSEYLTSGENGSPTDNEDNNYNNNDIDDEYEEGYVQNTNVANNQLENDDISVTHDNTNLPVSASQVMYLQAK